MCTFPALDYIWTWYVSAELTIIIKELRIYEAYQYIVVLTIKELFIYNAYLYICLLLSSQKLLLEGYILLAWTYSTKVSMSSDLRQQSLCLCWRGKDSCLTSSESSCPSTTIRRKAKDLHTQCSPCSHWSQCSPMRLNHLSFQVNLLPQDHSNWYKNGFNNDTKVPKFWVNFDYV